MAFRPCSNLLLVSGLGESAGSSSPKNGKLKMETEDGGKKAIDEYSICPFFTSRFNQSIYIWLDTESEELNENEEKPKKEGSGLLAPLPLSDALIKFLGDGGESSLSRADVVKRLWEYIEQNDLQVCYLLSALLPFFFYFYSKLLPLQFFIS